MKNGMKIFCGAAAAGFLLMLLVTLVVIVPEINKKYDGELDRRDKLIVSLTADLDEQTKKFQEITGGQSRDLLNCQAAITTAHTRDSMFTLVYEPMPASAPPTSLALLDLVKPGLGSMLARMQSPQPAGGQVQMRLRYVLHGIVAPVAAVPGAKFLPTPEVQLQ